MKKLFLSICMFKRKNKLLILYSPIDKAVLLSFNVSEITTYEGEENS